MPWMENFKYHIPALGREKQLEIKEVEMFNSN